MQLTDAALACYPGAGVEFGLTTSTKMSSFTFTSRDT